MKILATILFLLMPLVTFAQGYPSMNEQDMQKMMQQMQKMQTCMQSVDQEKLKEIEKQSKKFEVEIESLCSSGKRDKAQKKAISFGEKMMKAPEIKTMQKCSKMMIDAMPDMPFMDMDKDYSEHHVCDEIIQK